MRSLLPYILKTQAFLINIVIISEIVLLNNVGAQNDSVQN